MEVRGTTETGRSSAPRSALMRQVFPRLNCPTTTRLKVSVAIFSRSSPREAREVASRLIMPSTMCRTSSLRRTYSRIGPGPSVVFFDIRPCSSIRRTPEKKSSAALRAPGSRQDRTLLRTVSGTRFHDPGGSEGAHFLNLRQILDRQTLSKRESCPGLLSGQEHQETGKCCRRSLPFLAENSMCTYNGGSRKEQQKTFFRHRGP